MRSCPNEQRAGMKTPAYRRRIACGVLPAPKSKDLVTHGLALVFSELDSAAAQTKEKTSKRAMFQTRDRSQSMLKRGLDVDVTQSARNLDAQGIQQVSYVTGGSVRYWTNESTPLNDPISTIEILSESTVRKSGAPVKRTSRISSAARLSND